MISNSSVTKLEDDSFDVLNILSLYGDENPVSNIPRVLILPFLLYLIQYHK